MARWRIICCERDARTTNDADGGVSNRVSSTRGTMIDSSTGIVWFQNHHSRVHVMLCYATLCHAMQPRTRHVIVEDATRAVPPR